MSLSWVRNLIFMYRWVRKKIVKLLYELVLITYHNFSGNQSYSPFERPEFLPLNRARFFRNVSDENDSAVYKLLRYWLRSSGNHNDIFACLIHTSFRYWYLPASTDIFCVTFLCCKIVRLVHTLLISRGAILNIKFMTSFAESNLSSYVGSMSRAMSSVLVHLVSCDKSHSSCSCCRINPHTNYTKEQHNCDHLSLIKRLSSQFHLG